MATTLSYRESTMIIREWHIIIVLFVQFIFTTTGLQCNNSFERANDQTLTDERIQTYFVNLLDNHVNSNEIRDRYHIEDVLNSRIPDGYIISDVLSSNWPALRGNIVERYPQTSNEAWIIALTGVDLSVDDPRPAIIQVWIPGGDGRDRLLVQQLQHRGCGGPSNPTIIEDMGWFVMGGEHLLYVVAVLNKWNCRSISVFSVDDDLTHINPMYEEAFLTDCSPLILLTADCLDVGFAAYQRPWASNADGPDYGSLEMAFFDAEGNRARYYIELENILSEDELARAITHGHSSIYVSSEIENLIVYKIAMGSDWWDSMIDITDHTWAQIDKQENEGWVETDTDVQL